MLFFSLSEWLLILCVAHLYIPTIYYLLARAPTKQIGTVPVKIHNKRDKKAVMVFELISQNNKLSQQLTLMREKVNDLNVVSALYKHFETRIEKQSSTPRADRQTNPLYGTTSTPTPFRIRPDVRRRTPNTAEICQDLFGVVDDEVIFEVSQKTSDSSGKSSH